MRQRISTVLNAAKRIAVNCKNLVFAYIKTVCRNTKTKLNEFTVFDWAKVIILSILIITIAKKDNFNVEEILKLLCGG